MHPGAAAWWLLPLAVAVVVGWFAHCDMGLRALEFSAPSGLPPFLSEGPAGSSGIMILEYVAHDALGTLRHAASPVTLGTAVISRGLEDHASFSTHAVRSTVAATAAFRTVLACELLAAVRALRMARTELPDTPLREAFRLAVGSLPYLGEDHPLSTEIGQAERLLDRLAVL